VTWHWAQTRLLNSDLSTFEASTPISLSAAKSVNPLEILRTCLVVMAVNTCGPECPVFFRSWQGLPIWCLIVRKSFFPFSSLGAYGVYSSGRHRGLDPRWIDLVELVAEHMCMPAAHCIQSQSPPLNRRPYREIQTVS